MRILLTVIILSLSQVTLSQQEGYVKYHIDVKAVDSTNETLQAVSMMRNSKMEIYYTQNKARMDFKMGSYYSSSIIVDEEKDSTLTLNGSPYGNYFFLSDLSAKDTSFMVSDGVELIETKSKKVILGIDCYKQYLIKDRDTSIYWCTNTIDARLGVEAISNPHIKGFPLEFSRLDNNVLITFTASNLRDYVSNKENLFSLIPPKDYKPLPVTEH